MLPSITPYHPLRPTVHYALVSYSHSLSMLLCSTIVPHQFGSKDHIIPKPQLDMITVQLNEQ